MLVKLREVYRTDTNYSAPHSYASREVLINTAHVVRVTENAEMPVKITEGVVTGVESTNYCNVVIGSGQYSQELVVESSLRDLQNLLYGKELLNG
tara:strand:- start:843 stop:1127 length:285 start_codon:yes stop_codon:yes gene_type:complete